MPRIGDMIWPAWPSTPPEAPEGLDDEREADGTDPDCARCRRRVGPPHVPSTPGHRDHCSCDGCW